MSECVKDHVIYRYIPGVSIKVNGFVTYTSSIRFISKLIYGDPWTVDFEISWTDQLECATIFDHMKVRDAVSAARFLDGDGIESCSVDEAMVRCIYGE